MVKRGVSVNSWIALGPIRWRKKQIWHMQDMFIGSSLTQHRPPGPRNGRSEWNDRGSASAPLILICIYFPGIDPGVILNHDFLAELVDGARAVRGRQGCDLVDSLKL